MNHFLGKLNMFLKLYNLEKWLVANKLSKESIAIHSFLKDAGKKEEILTKYQGHPRLDKIKKLIDELPGFSQQYIFWGVKQIENNEPLDEIIDMIKSFDLKYKNKLKAKGKSADLFSYKTLGELRGAIEEIGSKSRTDISGEASAGAKKIYEDSQFLVIYPETKEASIHFGRGTKWCVAATESKNYFEEYAGYNVFLYFIINKNGDKVDPMYKIAYAYTKSDIEFQNSVQIFDSTDKEIAEGLVKEYLGSKFGEIKAAIENHKNTQDNTKFKDVLLNASPEEVTQLQESGNKGIINLLYDNFKELKNEETKRVVVSRIGSSIYFLDQLFEDYPQFLETKARELSDHTFFEGLIKLNEIPLDKLAPEETKRRIHEMSGYDYFNLGIDDLFDDPAVAREKASKIEDKEFFLTRPDSQRRDVDLKDWFPDIAKQKAKNLSINHPTQFFALDLDRKYEEFTIYALKRLNPNQFFKVVGTDYYDSPLRETYEISKEKAKLMDFADFFVQDMLQPYFPDVALEKAKNLNSHNFFAIGLDKLYPDLTQSKRNDMTPDEFENAQREYIVNTSLF